MVIGLSEGIVFAPMFVEKLLCLVNPLCLITEIFRVIAEKLINGALGLIGTLYQLIIYTPHPPSLTAWFSGSAGGVWGDMWNKIYGQSVVIASIILLMELFFIFFFAAFSAFIGSYQKEKLFRRWMLATLFVWGWPFIGGAALSFVHYFAEILVGATDPVNIANNILGGGSVSISGGAAIILVLAIVVWIAGWAELLIFLGLLAMYAARNFLLITYLWAMPILIAFWPIDVGFLKPMSQQAESWMKKMVPLLLLTLPNAFLLRMATIINNSSGTFAGLLFGPLYCTSCSNPILSGIGVLFDFTIVMIIPIVALILPKFIFGIADSLTSKATSTATSAALTSGQFEKTEDGDLVGSDGTVAQRAEQTQQRAGDAARATAAGAGTAGAAASRAAKEKGKETVPDMSPSEDSRIGRRIKQGKDMAQAGRRRGREVQEGARSKASSVRSYAYGQGEITDDVQRAKNPENRLNDNVESDVSHEQRLQDWDAEEFMEAVEEGDDRKARNLASQLRGDLDSDADEERVAEEYQSLAAIADEDDDLDFGSDEIHQAAQTALGINQANELPEETGEVVAKTKKHDRMERLSENEDLFRKSDPNSTEKQLAAASLLNADADTDISEMRKERDRLKEEADMYGVDETTIDHAFDTATGQAENGLVGTNSWRDMDEERTPRSRDTDDRGYDTTPADVSEGSLEDAMVPEKTAVSTDVRGREDEYVETPEMSAAGPAVAVADLPPGADPQDKPLQDMDVYPEDLGVTAEERVENLSQHEENIINGDYDEMKMKNISAGAALADENTTVAEMEQNIKQLEQVNNGEVDEEVFEKVRDHTTAADAVPEVPGGSETVDDVGSGVDESEVIESEDVEKEVSFDEEVDFSWDTDDSSDEN